MNAALLDQLHTTFGFTAFRGVQADVIARVMAGARTLAVMPTGAGKSLCYQLPAVMMSGTCVVISPLIALMHDQMRAADAVGIRAATLTSVDENRAETRARFRDGDLDLLYVAPERASSPEFCGSACLRLMRRIAFRNGGMISAPIIGCSPR
jgi:ATP-dependent DNA helicase RecQ